MRVFILAVWLACLWPVVASTQTVGGTPAVTEVDLGSKDFSLSFEPGADSTRVKISIPRHGGVMIMLDGDQDGRWGIGAYDPKLRPMRSADLLYNVHSSGGDAQLCPQYLVFSRDDRGNGFVSTVCGVFKTKAKLSSATSPSAGQVAAVLDIPNAELFGDKPDARLVFCMWQDEVHTCRYSLAQPLVLKRTGS